MAELGPNSRYRLAYTVQDEARGLNYGLLRRTRIAFDANAQNREYIGQSGDNLFTAAARFFRGWERPASLFWLVGEYQPTPIFDPWLDLDGRTLYIPPAEKVAEILRRDEANR